MNDPAMYTNEQLNKLETSCKDVSGWGEINPRVTYRLIELMRAGNQRMSSLEAEAAAIRQGLQFVVTNLEEAGEDFGEIDAAVIGGMAKSALSSTAGADLLRERTEDKARIEKLQAFVREIAFQYPQAQLCPPDSDCVECKNIRQARSLLEPNEETGK